MLTILHTEASKGWGGQENRILNEAIGLTQRGARVLIAAQPESGLARRAEQQGIPVHLVPMRSNFDFKALAQLRRIMRDELVDVVNTHSGRDNTLAGLAAKTLRRRPAIVRTRHLALPITARFSYTFIPDRIVTVSHYVASYLITAGVPQNKIEAIPTGVDLTRYDPEHTPSTLRAELGVADDTPLIGTVAILRLKKGHRTLLEAIPAVLAHFPQARFVFAGDGPQRANIEKAIAELGLGESVHLLGLRADVPTVLRALDVFVLPTFEEALGTSFVEAMAMRVPVIGSRVGGVPEVVRDQVTGLLVNPQDSADLRRAILALLSDPAHARSMGQAGRQVVEQEFTNDKMCDRMLQLYTALLAARAVR